MATDRRTLLVVVLLAVTSFVELGSRGQHRPTEPDGVPLHRVGDDVDLERESLDLSTAQLLAPLNPVVNSTLNITLETLAKITEHGRTTRQNNVLVETTTAIDGAALDGVIDNLGERDQKIRGEDLGVEEGLGTQETFVSNVDVEGPLGDGLNSLVLLDPLLTTTVVLPKFLDDIGANVAVSLLDTLGDLTRHGGGDGGTFAVPHQLLDERGDGAPSKGDGLDAATNNVTLSDGDDVSNTSTRVNNGTGKGSVGNLRGSPRGSNSKDSLNGNVQPRDVEGLEHNLSGVLTVLGGVERRLGQQDVVVLRLTTEVFEETVLPKLFHLSPAPHLTLINGVVLLIASGSLSSLVTNEEVQIGDVGVTLLVGLGSRASNLSLGNGEGDGGRDNKVRLAVSGETHLGVPSTIINDNRGETRLAHLFSWG